MKPEDVWIIYNKTNQAILRVFAEKFLADRIYEEYIGPNGPIYGSTPNKDKLVLITLERALHQIQMDHLADLNRESVYEQ